MKKLIITTQKPFEEVEEMTKGLDKLFVIGCGLCASECQTGGEEQVKEIIMKLKEIGKEVTGSVVPESGCDQRVLRIEFRKNKPAIAKAEALLVISCGIGTQTAMEISEMIVIPGNNTKFLGTIERIGRFYERCSACGDCKLFETMGICPIARCPKGLLNGPCAGHMDGKCEADREKDCVWILIYERLKKLGQLDKMRKFQEPRDYGIITKPQEVVWR